MVFILSSAACSLQTLFGSAVFPSPNRSPEQTNTVKTSQPTTSIDENPTITVFFTDQEKFMVGTLPYEAALSRPLLEGVERIRAVLDTLFSGRTPEESAQGLVLVSSGFIGVREFEIKEGTALIHLEGKCSNNGAAYSIANVIAKNLEQFSEIGALKIYDENDNNLDPDSEFSSLPYCLEP